MKPTTALRQQHLELMHIASEVTRLLRGLSSTQDTTLARLELGTWVRKFRVHVTLEDRLVYSRLIHNSDAAVRAKAAEHQREMRIVREQVARYTSTGLVRNLSSEIGAARLLEETAQLFELVASKFEAEELDLFGIVDDIPSGKWAIAHASAIAEDERLSRKG